MGFSGNFRPFKNFSIFIPHLPAVTLGFYRMGGDDEVKIDLKNREVPRWLFRRDQWICNGTIVQTHFKMRDLKTFYPQRPIYLCARVSKWSTEADSRSVPEGVRGFNSLPSHSDR